MAKQKVLIVDNDLPSLKQLEASIRQAGYIVTVAANGKEALKQIEVDRPDLIISDTSMPEMDGFELCKRLKESPDYREIIFVFLSKDKNVESKIKGLEIGADEYLTKPIFIREIVTRVKLLLNKKMRERFEVGLESKAHFRGSFEDMSLVDLIQTFQVSGKSGVLYLSYADSSGAIYFSKGEIIDAHLDTLKGEEAIYKFFLWPEGKFEIEFREVREKRTIHTPTEAIIMEGVKQMDEWTKIVEQLPPLNHICEIDYTILSERFKEIPEELDMVIKLFDGKRNLFEIINRSPFDDIKTVSLLSKLYFDGVLYDPELEGEELIVKREEILKGGKESTEEELVDRAIRDSILPEEGGERVEKLEEKAEKETKEEEGSEEVRKVEEERNVEEEKREEEKVEVEVSEEKRSEEVKVVKERGDEEKEVVRLKDEEGRVSTLKGIPSTQVAESERKIVTEEEEYFEGESYIAYFGGTRKEEFDELLSEEGKKSSKGFYIVGFLVLLIIGGAFSIYIYMRYFSIDSKAKEFENIPIEGLTIPPPQSKKISKLKLGFKEEATRKEVLKEEKKEPSKEELTLSSNKVTSQKEEGKVEETPKEEKVEEKIGGEVSSTSLKGESNLPFTPGSPEAVKEAKKLVNKAIQWLEIKAKYEDAMELAQKAVTFDPNNSTGWFIIGYISEKKGELEKAKESYKKCVDLGGDVSQDCKLLLQKLK